MGLLEGADYRFALGRRFWERLLMYSNPTAITTAHSTILITMELTSSYLVYPD
jgi:hypothetical protein